MEDLDLAELEDQEMRAYHAYLNVMDRGPAMAEDAYEKWLKISDALREARYALEQSV